MRVELGAPVIVVQLPGGLGEGLYHLPAPHREVAAPHATTRRRMLVDETCPDEWPTVCGLDGIVYGYDGVIRRRRMCGVCLRHAPHALLTADGAYTDPEPDKRGGGKPQWKHSRLKPEHLRVLYQVRYLGEGLGVYRIAAPIWQQFGFASQKSCSEAIYRGFVALGFELRSQSEATALKNYRHGRKTRAIGESGAAVAEYRRWLREQRGSYRPVCRAVKTQSPGKGKPCTKPAMRGSAFCWSHDPGRAGERHDQAAAMRAKAAEIPTVEWARVRQLLDPWLAEQKHPPMALRRATGVAHVYALLADRFDRIEVTTARKLLAGVGLSFWDVYEQNERRAA